MPAVQSTYSESHAVAQLGMIADSRPKSVRSLTYEGAAKLGFGIAVGFTSNNNGCDLDGTGFAGIVVSTQVKDPAVETDGYKQYDEVGCMATGAIWVKPTANVAVGDPVTFVAATGAISNTGGVTIPDAVFETAAQAGELARIFIK